MDNIIDFKKMKDKKDWEDFAKAQIDVIMKLQVENNKLQDKITHLELLLNNVPSNLAVASNEEELCKIEIARLFNKAKSLPLEWQETRAFEVYAKTLLAIKGKTVDDIKKNKSKEQKLSDSELLQIAMQSVSDESEQ